MSIDAFIIMYSGLFVVFFAILAFIRCISLKVASKCYSYFAETFPTAIGLGGALLLTHILSNQFVFFADLKIQFKAAISVLLTLVFSGYLIYQIKPIFDKFFGCDHIER